MMELTAHGRQGAYPIHVAHGLIGRSGDYLAPFANEGRLIVVSDRSVWTRYKGEMARGCSGLALEPIIIAPGEMSKSWAVLKMLVNKLLNAGANRDTTIIAFGGGVVGDLAGFAASILHRGCRFVQIPTTLLSQVDSSVGGKTGINTRHGKNQVGTVHEPSMVLIDPALLANLQPRQLRSGYAEILKIALVNRPDFFDWLEEHADACLSLEPEPLCHAIASALQGKIELVKGDELDRSGQRMLLNFGHSFGHAIEAATHFKIPHGEAVALGMMLAFKLSAELGLCDGSDARRVGKHLAMTGLPTKLADVGLAGRGSELGKLLKSDKKVHLGSPQFIMTRGIGQAYVDPHLGITRVSRFLSENAKL